VSSRSARGTLSYKLRYYCYLLWIPLGSISRNRGSFKSISALLGISFFRICFGLIHLITVRSHLTYDTIIAPHKVGVEQMVQHFLCLHHISLFGRNVVEGQIFRDEIMHLEACILEIEIASTHVVNRNFVGCKFQITQSGIVDQPPIFDFWQNKIWRFRFIQWKVFYEFHISLSCPHI